MTSALSANTQAILLLTAPLIAGRGTPSPELLSPRDYKRLAQHLKELQRQPADLMEPDAGALFRDCHPVIDESRLQRLLGRGLLLSQVIERWQARAIWVVSRADREYPRRFKLRMREDAPAIIYGCGDLALLESGGLAVVGSRRVDDTLIDYTMEIGRLTATAGKTIVSGGAKGIDQAAMRGALEAGGQACGVLADSLEKTSMSREYRNWLLDGRLVLISPYDPAAGFNVGHAMQRNKLIYALSDASLVVNSDLNKGGTWAGAVEQLDMLNYVPVYVRSTGTPSQALHMLQMKGARLWPSAQDSNALDAVFCSGKAAPESRSLQGLALPASDPPMEAWTPMISLPEKDSTCEPTTECERDATATEGSESLAPGIVAIVDAAELPAAGLSDAQTSPTSTAADTLFSTVRAIIQPLLCDPRTEAEVAKSLDVSPVQARDWLQRLVASGYITRTARPVRYVWNARKADRRDEPQQTPKQLGLAIVP